MLTERDLFPNLGRLTASEVSRLTMQERTLLRVCSVILTADDLTAMRDRTPNDDPDEVLLAITQ